MPMVPCLWTDMLPTLDPPEAIGWIGASGFRQVEFGLTHEALYLEGADDEEHRLKAIRDAAERAGVDILQMHGYLFNLCGENAAEGVARAHRSLRRAAALGVKWVVLHPGSGVGFGADPEARKETRQQNLTAFRSFLETAEEVGTGIAIENMIGGRPRFGATVDDLLWLVNELNSERVGICWDTGHAHLSGLDQGKSLRAIGRHLVALHIADNDGASDKHWAPLRGNVDWKEVVGALHDINFQGPFNLEVPGESRVTPLSAQKAKISYLHELCTAMLAPSFVS